MTADAFKQRPIAKTLNDLGAIMNVTMDNSSVGRPAGRDRDWSMLRWIVAAWVSCWVPSTASHAASAVDSALLGGVTVVIQPADAIADGAAWSIDGRPERASGIHEAGLLPGRHIVRFRDLVDWQEPDPAEVLVVGGRVSTLTAAYLPLPSFYFKAIPEQHARTGKPVEFLIRPSDPDDPQSQPANATVSVSISPQTAGPVSFDPVTGHFRYAPSALDRLPLTLTLSAGQGPVATTTITPLNPLIAEASVINLDRSMPDPESRDFVTITETKNPSKPFNDENREVLTIDIAGHTLVFEADHPAHLFEAFNNRNNVEKFRLYADRVIIRSPLVLPQTDVTIFARELRFERNGSITTTPIARGKKPAPNLWETEAILGINGDPAHEGGDVEAFVERFHSDGSQPTRFFLNGGLGGDAGEGRHGRNETTLGFLSPDWNLLMRRCGIPVCGTTLKSEVIVHLDSKFLDDPSEFCGRKTTVRGENAIPAGKPGNGGPGGSLRSTLSLPALAEQAGGKAGKKGTNCIAGKLSARAFVYRTDRTIALKNELVNRITDKPAPKGLANDALAPEATVLVGPSGTTERITNSMEWLHSFSVRSMIQFAKDA